MTADPPDNDTGTGTDLDPVRRLRVMAAGLNAVMYAEEYVDLPVDEVWAVASDLDAELPQLVPAMRAFRTTATLPSGRSTALAYGPFGHRARFDVQLRPGWCLMQSAHVVGGMAAVPEGSGTRFAVLGGVRHAVPGPVRRAVRPLGRARGHRMIARARRRTEARRTETRRTEARRTAAQGGDGDVNTGPAQPT
ncbi:hypothetical protein [Streptomyces sp. NPDC059009]|uniref:hypothetical protein n=1 Tax=Streptomyces sp. NPDC059009 TaxID=3346694 RepID=UPI0036C3365A